jgi:hypothetical protein
LSDECSEKPADENVQKVKGSDASSKSKAFPGVPLRSPSLVFHR